MLEIIGTIVDKAMDLLKGSKVGQKIISLANQARNYFKQVDEVVWHFFRSADTQKIGPSAPLKKLLEDYGIKVVIYE